MRKLILAAITLVIFGAGWIFGQEVKTSSGGAAWQASQDAERQFYAFGFKDGYTRGVSDASAKQVDEKTLAGLTPSQREGLEANLKEQEFGFWPIHKNSPRVLAAAVSDFYDDDEQNASICWQQAMMLTAMKLGEVKLTPEELAVARKKGLDQGCR